MIRTAIPCGYLLIVLFFGTGFFLGIGLLIAGLLRRNRLLAWTGGGMVAAIVVVVAVELWFEASMVWNPRIGSDAEVVGTWVGKDETLTLASDKTFSRRTGSGTSAGTWSRYHWNLTLSSKESSDKMLFIQFRGRNRLMTHPPEDPDMWDGDLGLKRVEGSSAKP